MKCVVLLTFSLVAIQGQKPNPIDVPAHNSKGQISAGPNFDSFLTVLGDLLVSYDAVKGAVQVTINATVQKSLETLEELACGVDNKCIRGMKDDITTISNVKLSSFYVCLDALRVEAKLNIDLAIVELKECFNDGQIEECKSQSKACFKHIKELVTLPSCILDSMSKIIVVFTLWGSQLTICANKVILDVYIGILEIFCRLTECTDSRDHDRSSEESGEPEIDSKR